MEHKNVRRVILAGVIAFGIAGRAWGQQQQLAAKPADSSLSMARYYAGSVASIGTFPGTLVRLSCGSSGGTNVMGQNDQRGRDYALIVHGDDAMHPLLPGTDEVRRELDSVDLQGTDVAVHGKYYPSTGWILVSRIVVVARAAVHNDEASRAEIVGLTTGRDGLRLARCASD